MAWTGNEVRKARNAWIVQLTLPCCRCGKPVTRDMKWQVDHYPIPREFGGTQTWPAHAYCNMSAGGKRGAKITNMKKRNKVNEGRNIRGI